MSVDLTLASSVYRYDGVGSHSIAIISALLNSNISMNLVKFEPFSLKGITDINVLDIINKPVKEFGKTLFWVNILGLNEKIIEVHKMLKSPFKIAMSMFESTKIPPMWTIILNTYYDMVVVPNEWLIPVYKNSGVKIPIFCLPLGTTVNSNWWNIQSSHKPNPFIFTMTGGFWERKNHALTMRAFANQFRDNPNVKLRIHGRFGPGKQSVIDTHKELNCSNIELLTNILPQAEYDAFMESTSAYVFLSKSEGFSQTPRESLIQGKPVVLSDNSAHKTITKQKDIGVVAVCANKRMPAYYELFNATLGDVFDVEQEDAEKAMVEVYENYEKYKTQAETAGREWAKQYQWSELKNRYMMLVKPTKLVLGNKNEIFSTHFETNNKKLYNKLKKEFNL